jgi:hypothetical protein
MLLKSLQTIDLIFFSDFSLFRDEDIISPIAMPTLPYSPGQVIYENATSVHVMTPFSSTPVQELEEFQTGFITPLKPNLEAALEKIPVTSKNSVFDQLMKSAFPRNKQTITEELEEINSSSDEMTSGEESGDEDIQTNSDSSDFEMSKMKQTNSKKSGAEKLSGNEGDTQSSSDSSEFEVPKKKQTRTKKARAEKLSQEEDIQSSSDSSYFETPTKKQTRRKRAGTEKGVTQPGTSHGQN